MNDKPCRPPLPVEVDFSPSLDVPPDGVIVYARELAIRVPVHGPSFLFRYQMYAASQANPPRKGTRNHW